MSNIAAELKIESGRVILRLTNQSANPDTINRVAIQGEGSEQEPVPFYESVDGGRQVDIDVTDIVRKLLSSGQAPSRTSLSDLAFFSVFITGPHLQVYKAQMQGILRSDLEKTMQDKLIGSGQALTVNED